MISADELDALHRRIAELEACLKKELDMAEEWQAMYALLEKVPHVPALHVGFFPNCPACAWSKLKEAK